MSMFHITISQVHGVKVIMEQKNINKRNQIDTCMQQKGTISAELY